MWRPPQEDERQIWPLQPEGEVLNPDWKARSTRPVWALGVRPGDKDENWQWWSRERAVRGRAPSKPKLDWAVGGKPRTQKARDRRRFWGRRAWRYGHLPEHRVRDAEDRDRRHDRQRASAKKVGLYWRWRYDVGSLVGWRLWDFWRKQNYYEEERVRGPGAVATHGVWWQRRTWSRRRGVEWPEGLISGRREGRRRGGWGGSRRATVALGGSWHGHQERLRAKQRAQVRGHWRVLKGVGWKTRGKRTGHLAFGGRWSRLHKWRELTNWERRLGSRRWSGGVAVAAVSSGRSGSNRRRVRRRKVNRRLERRQLGLKQKAVREQWSKQGRRRRRVESDSHRRAWSRQRSKARNVRRVSVPRWLWRPHTSSRWSEAEAPSVGSAKRWGARRGSPSEVRRLQRSRELGRAQWETFSPRDRRRSLNSRGLEAGWLKSQEGQVGEHDFGIPARRWAHRGRRSRKRGWGERGGVELTDGAAVDEAFTGRALDRELNIWEARAWWWQAGVSQWSWTSAGDSWLGSVASVYSRSGSGWGTPELWLHGDGRDYLAGHGRGEAGRDQVGRQRRSLDGAYLLPGQLEPRGRRDVNGDLWSVGGVDRKGRSEWLEWGVESQRSLLRLEWSEAGLRALGSAVADRRSRLGVGEGSRVRLGWEDGRGRGVYARQVRTPRDIRRLGRKAQRWSRWYSWMRPSSAQLQQRSARRWRELWSHWGRGQGYWRSDLLLWVRGWHREQGRGDKLTRARRAHWQLWEWWDWEEGRPWSLKRKYKRTRPTVIA